MTTKPPTTLAVPSTTAQKPTTIVSVSASARPATRIAPTRTIPWIAFVPDISGVCSIVGTFEITSIPRKIASTRIVSSKTRTVVHYAVTRSRVTQAPPVISSSKSSASSPPGARWSRSAMTLRE